MSDENERLPLLDPVAFVLALVLSPILIAVLFFWLALVPVAALFFGAIPYLVFGTPVLLWMVTHVRVSFDTFALGGLFAQALFVLSLAIWHGADPYPQPLGLTFLALWGIPFSAVWCGNFALLYRRFHKPFVFTPASERNA